jgi:hypothetical protein
MVDHHFGKQPAPVTGQRTADPANDILRRRASGATTALANIWIEHEPQRAIIAELLKYRDDTAGRRGVPLSGRRLSEHSQAGKSATMARLKAELAAERARAGLPPNPYQVVIVELDRRMTLKAFYQETLKALGDEYWAQPASTKMLEGRIEDWVLRLEVEILIADEVQHLLRKANDAGEVTDKLKVFLDRGVVPLVLVGDEDSVTFFRANKKLAARLGDPLKLVPLDPNSSKRDAQLFKAFCRKLDEELVSTDIFTKLSGLAEAGMLDGLITTSSGHIGRVARLVEVAAPHAVWRGAMTLEAYDLSHAVRGYAFENQWVDHDPFAINAR